MRRIQIQTPAWGLIFLLLAITYASSLSEARYHNSPLRKMSRLSATPRVGKDKLAYGILLDAGSGSTKPTVWSWDPCYAYNELPELELFQKLDKLPALASFAPSQGGSPMGAGPMLGLGLEEIKKVVPEDMWEHTPVFLSATAGMRLLPESERAQILREVNVWLADPSNHPFLYGTRPPFDDGQFWAQTISGDEEGVYGFIDVNYLSGKLVGQHPKSDPDNLDPAYVLSKNSPGAVGWIDTGGASLQVTFAPQESSVLGNVFPVTPLEFIHITNSTGSRYASETVYTHSWNGLGQREARKRLQRGIAGRANTALGDLTVEDRETLSDPCLLVGQQQVMHITSPTGGTRNVTFVGGSDYYMCVWFLDVLVLNMNVECLMQPCAATGTYCPSPGSIVFLGFRKMLDIVRPLGLASKHGSWAPSYDELAKTVRKVCEMSADEVKAAGIEDEWETDSGPCFQGVLMMRFLQSMGSPKMVFSDRVGKKKEHKFNYARGAMLTYIVQQSERADKPPGWPVCQPKVSDY